ncbi:hypothetical protein LZ198_37390 [Myxococcus sp. K15C18031901]|uniref:hypothetical protein n=1 Tax=Myxococcus dinghuensis TaxID=2906761 RepID=UPI0020A75575|nr:hypothetical protein [Myxococcus dinghuensis]MCP3104552.1 hypothetical protein [Myxococcus dinghuensis]
MPLTKEMMRPATAILLGASVALSWTSADAANEGCTMPASNQLLCELRSGTYTFTVKKGVYVKLLNNTGTYLQIDQLQGAGADAGGFGEYGACLNRFSTDQNPAGAGEVGGAVKDSGQTYPPGRWDNPAEATGLSVPPGSTVYLNYNSAAPKFTYTVTTRRQTTGIAVWRQPQADQTISCNGARQSTKWGGWKNTGGVRYLRGAQIYSVSAKPDPTMTDDACLYILDINGRVRWSMCDGVNKRGRIAVSPVQAVQPGETVAAQASNTCAPPAVWDWVAYIYISS